MICVLGVPYIHIYVVCGAGVPGNLAGDTPLTRLLHFPIT
jgi:hypothetical protein